jgi:hypothetical protein
VGRLCRVAAVAFALAYVAARVLLAVGTIGSFSSEIDVLAGDERYEFPEYVVFCG